MHSGFVRQLLSSILDNNLFELQMWQLPLLGNASLQPRRQNYSVRASVEPRFETSSLIGSNLTQGTEEGILILCFISFRKPVAI